MQQEGPEALDLRQALDVLRRRAALIILCVVVVGGAAYGYSKHQTKQYTATASVAFTNNSLAQQIAGLTVNSGGIPAVQQSNDLELVRLGDMAANTAKQLGHGLTTEKVSNSLSIGSHGESNVIAISATMTSPVLAADVVNAYAHQFVNEQQSASQRYIRSALALVDKQLNALPRKQRLGADGVDLQDRAQKLELLASLQYSNVQLAQEAAVPSSASSPKTSRNTLLGVFVGLFIGLGLAFLLEHLGRRVKRPEDLEAIYSLPLLGVVPKSKALSRSTRPTQGEYAALPPTEAEAFNLIRAHLRFFNVNRDLRTILIASPAPSDGKTTIACHLAEAAARLGSRVLLIEVDMRHPTLARQLDLQSGPGLAGVLIGAVPMDEATGSVNLQTPPGEGAKGRTLDVLAAGAYLPPNPAELLESSAIDALLEQARSAYDLVVIDTPPLTAVSDAFPLLTKVDGVVVVGWIGRSRRDAAERLHQVLSSSGAPLLGVIANGSKLGGPRPSYSDTKSDTALPPIISADGAPSSDELASSTANV